LAKINFLAIWYGIAGWYFYRKENKSIKFLDSLENGIEKEEYTSG
jgi:hypothetical protein